MEPRRAADTCCACAGRTGPGSSPSSDGQRGERRPPVTGRPARPAIGRAIRDPPEGTSDALSAGEGSPMRASSLCAVALMVLEGSAARPARGRVTPPVSEPGPAHALSRAFATVAQAIGPSVVRLEVSGDREDSTASGIIIDTRGNVVTSSHLFDGWTPPAGGASRGDCRRAHRWAQPFGRARRTGRRE